MRISIAGRADGSGARCIWPSTKRHWKYGMSRSPRAAWATRLSCLACCRRSPKASRSHPSPPTAPTTDSGGKTKEGRLPSLDFQRELKATPVLEHTNKPMPRHMRLKELLTFFCKAYGWWLETISVISPPKQQGAFRTKRDILKAQEHTREFAHAQANVGG